MPASAAACLLWLLALVGLGAAPGLAASGSAAGAPAVNIHAGNGPAGDFDAWAEWWRAQRPGYFPPSPHGEREGALGLEGGAAVEAELRERLLGLARASLGANESVLRRAAAIALARVGGEESEAELAALVADGDARVRRTALIALGTLGGDRARQELLKLALLDRPRPEQTLDGATAMVALGLLRQGFADSRVDELLDARTRSAATLPPELARAAMLHARLARANTPFLALDAAARDEALPTEARALALGAIARSGEAREFDVLAELVLHRDVALRTAAAEALGSSRDARATERLLAALDAERNLAARGLLVLSLGRVANEAAVNRLLVERQRASALDRAWAWLALGLAARAGDRRARAELVLAPDAKLQGSEHASTLLAIGLARQTSSFELLSNAALQRPDSALAPYAADGLALMATGLARERLRKGLERSVESSRPRFAEGLARFRRPEDAALLVSAWTRTATVGARRDTGLALGRHGTRETLGALLAVAADEKAPANDRATALEAASLSLSRRAPDRLSVLDPGTGGLPPEDWVLELANSGL